MGPTLIFDKSLLQSLNPDESVWLQMFYLTNITPLFFVETLADLEKEVRRDRTPEQVVGSIAYKTPDSAYANAHHGNMIYGEVSHQTSIEMSGRPLVSSGQEVKLGNEKGVIFEESKESEAVQNWQSGKFLEVERLTAKQWRENLSNLNHEQNKEIISRFFKISALPKSLDELKAQVDNIIKTYEQRTVLIFGLSAVDISSEWQKKIIQIWQKNGSKPIKVFAPYFTHVLSVNLFFYLGCTANLFSAFRHPQTHKVDIAYLYYLPFCNIFVSSDNFHISTAPFFLRSDQTFVKSIDFKADLNKLDNHYSTLPKEIKNRGVWTFASHPPKDTTFLTTCLWDKYMIPNWRDLENRKFDGTDQIDLESDKAIMEEMKRFAKESTPIEEDSRESIGNINKALIKQKISKRKGKWRMFPPEVENSRPMFD